MTATTTLTAELQGTRVPVPPARSPQGPHRVDSRWSDSRRRHRVRPSLSAWSARPPTRTLPSRPTGVHRPDHCGDAGGEQRRSHHRARHRHRHGGDDVGSSWIDVSDGRRTCRRPHPRHSLELRHDDLQRSLHSQLCGARAVRGGSHRHFRPGRRDRDRHGPSGLGPLRSGRRHDYRWLRHRAGVKRAGRCHRLAVVSLLGVCFESGQGDVVLGFVSAPNRVTASSGQGDVTVELPKGPNSYQVHASSGQGNVVQQRGRQPGQRSGDQRNLWARGRHRPLPLQVT